MAKKVKTVQMLSPENYIRTKARSLPIHECLVNSDWKESGIANVMVTRKHTNGNYTFAIYLVDLYCLGLKNSLYMFNKSEPDYRDKLEEMKSMNDLIKIDYTLAHNIIFAAIEFAGDFDFEPHKIFTDVTQFMLQEDTDDVELIDIECGLHGKPHYFQGPNDNSAMTSRIINQLERTAGRGNYYFTLIKGDSDPFKYKDNEDDEDEFDDEWDDRMSYAEALIMFEEHKADFGELDKQQIDLFLEAVEVLFDDLVDVDLREKYYDNFMEDLDMEIWSEDLPVELLGLTDAEYEKADLITAELMPIMLLSPSENKKSFQKIIELKDTYPECPFLSFLELTFSDEKEKGSAEFEKRLGQYLKQHPDYPLLKLLSLIQKNTNVTVQATESKLLPLHTLFSGRDCLHEIEFQQYIVYASLIVLFGSNLSKIAAFAEALEDLDFPFESMKFTFSAITVTKMKIVEGSLKK